MKPAGFNSVVGLSGAARDTQRAEATIKEMASDEELVHGAALNPSAENDLELATQQAVAAKATRFHEEKETTRLVEYRRIRGEIGEEVAAGNIPGSVKADSLSVSGTNFPNYDIFGKQEVSQVKVLSLQGGEPRYNEYQGIYKELVNPESEGNKAAASRLLEIKEQDPERWKQLQPNLPSEVWQANDPAVMRAALSENAVLRIPRDQVDQVRSNLQECGNDEAALQQKICPIDDRYATSDYQMKAAEVIGARDNEVKEKFGSLQNNSPDVKDQEEKTEYGYDQGLGF